MIDTLRRLVYDLCPHKHVLEIHSYCSSEASDPYNHTVRFCVIMVLLTGLSVNSVSVSQKNHTSTQEWHTLSNP